MRELRESKKDMLAGGRDLAPKIAVEFGDQSFHLTYLEAYLLASTAGGADIRDGNEADIMLFLTTAVYPKLPVTLCEPLSGDRHAVLGIKTHRWFAEECDKAIKKDRDATKARNRMMMRT